LPGKEKPERWGGSGRQKCQRDPEEESGSKVAKTEKFIVSIGGGGK